MGKRPAYSQLRLHTLQWSDLDFILPIYPSRLVLRHNSQLQYGYTPEPDETLQAALLHMERYCKTHACGNAKITGVVKVVEHTRLNNAPLWVKLVHWGK
jgi:hypothetical protein